MLLQFSVENFLSFREPQTLSMLAADGVEHPAHMVMEGPEGKKVLRCAAIYGANASGKSNLVKALEFGTNLVLKGTRPGDSMGVRPFKLDPACKDRPANFQWELSVEGKHYSYGFEITASTVVSEWLFSAEQNGSLAVFRRENGRIELDEKLASTPERNMFLRFVADGTRANQLFLAEARERNAFELALIWRVFEAYQCVRPDRLFAPLVEFFQAHEDFHEFASDLLISAGTGVNAIRLVETKDRFPAHLKEQLDGASEEGRSAYLDLLNKLWRDNAAGAIHVSENGLSALLTFHPVPGGTPQTFLFEEESDGTQRLVQLAPALYLFERTPSGILLAIDELERSLHPILTREFLSRFLASQSRSQLLFTTHDTNLLDLNLLSRDAIWFTEKDAAGATVLYSLAEYKSDQIAALGPQLEKGYLQGRFGAIPFLGDAARLGWKKAAE